MVLVQDGDIYIKLNDQGFPREGKKFDDGIRGQVKQIFIWHGEVIHSIQTTYQHNGDTLISPRRGGVGGRFDTVTLDEPLIWVSGHYGSWCWDPEIFALRRTLQMSTSRSLDPSSLALLERPTDHSVAR